MRGWTAPFTDPVCADPAVAGGKAANLARMTAAGLPVPPGFCVTTDAYAEFVEQAGLAARITETIGAAGGGAEEVEAATAGLRAAMVAAPMPDTLGDAIVAAYWKLGSGGSSYVAVRSSGTAEDLAGASFAGLHDTYLDIHGIDAMLDAVKRCWASMWTARATSYRATRGFDQQAARIAVVVQAMVPADVAGVTFTANPLTGATDEIVVNASWGLGEALVSGIATPDEHILALPDLRVKDQRVGGKERRVVRDPSSESGTVTEDTPAPDRERLALTRDQLHGVGEMGRQVMAYYGGIPQDIEWALAGGHLYLLQSRPATGADFSWDEDLEVWREFPDNPSILWSRSWADEVWNGGISPFAYSYRGEAFTRALVNNAKLWGLRRIDEPVFRYHRGTAYYNTGVDQRMVQETALPAFRVGPLLNHVPPDKHDEVRAAKLSVLSYLWIHARIAVLGRPVHGAFNYFRTVDDYLHNRVAEADGLSAEQLAALSDADLIGHVESLVELKGKNTEDQWTEFFIMARDAVSVLAGVIAKWHDPDPQAVLTDLLTGGPVRTTTAEENLWLWRLAMTIRGSDELRGLFAEHGVGYLEAFERCADGRAFLEEYRRFMAAHGHRGHADRDIYYPRRADDPTIDHQNFATLLAVTDPVDPQSREQEVAARRNAVIETVERNLRSQPLGGLKVKVFRGLLDYAHRFFLYRDNQRHYFDRYTYSMKRACLEIGGRLTARGTLTDAEQAYFLGRQECYELLRGAPVTELTRAKIAGRRANFLRMVERQARLPKYLRDGRAVSFDTGETTGGLVGVGTSRGVVTGRARVVLRLADMGQVKEGDILVTNSTDPGWTPVFTLLSAIVLETGGMLAHGSLLAREYGFPAVQIADATRLIPDGAMITVNGDTGEVTVVDDGGAADGVDQAEGERTHA
ncbi:MAG TPA: PEP/pyruvate-binding domain-containing protein [Pseudonocardia sp.]|nr:PEP/pyruvate-binding domain-containing protein [Pseudonocardia sp.]